MTENNNQIWTTLYQLLYLFKLPKPEIRYKIDNNTTVAVAFPQAHIAFEVARETKETKKPPRGWQIFYIDPMLLSALAPVFDNLQKTQIQIEVYKSKQEARRRVSKEEDTMLTALLEIGLPLPNRNYEFRNKQGTIICTPDFVWENAKLAVEVDGYYHHKGRDIDRETKKQVHIQENSSFVHDAIKRRFLAEKGWVSISVTDNELATGNASKIALEILGIYEARLKDFDSQ